MNDWSRVVALAGGVGGARLVHGLRGALSPGALSVVVNTGDDFDHWGLRICPDLDTVMYTLAGEAEMARGWGLRDETFGALEMVKRYGGEDWFMLGDRDLGTHILRTAWLREGAPLGEVTARLCRGLGVGTKLLPACEGRRTLIDTKDGRTLEFQDWLVGERGTPRVRAVRFVTDAAESPAGATPPGPGVLEALNAAELVVICPSNPFVSIEPILSLPGVRDAIEGRPVIGVSPIVGGRAVKGPLATMIPDLLGVPASAAAIASRYGGLLNALVVEPGDTPPAAERGETTFFETGVIMGGEADRVRLATEVLQFASALR